MQAIKDFFGGDAMNIVLGKAEVLLQNLPGLQDELTQKIQENDAFRLQEEGDLLRLTVLGRSAHAAAAARGIAAPWVAADLLKDCETLPATDRTILNAVAARLESPYGAGMGVDHEDPDFGSVPFELR